MILREAFDYAFSPVSPTGPHIDPCRVAIYELLVVKGESWGPQPGLAASWEVSADELEWRFQLRPNVRFHNEALRQEHPEDYGQAVADGTGPFALCSWSEERVVAERSEGYDGPPAKLDGIEWISMLDPAERLAALDRGDLHVLHGPPLDEVAHLAADDRFVVVEHPQPSNIYLGLDWRRTDLGFDDVRVRRAISLAIGRDAIVREALSGRGSSTWSLVPPGDDFYDAGVDRDRRRDVSRARELLGAARGDARVRCECVVQDDLIIRHVARLVADQLAEIGVTLELAFVKPFGPFYGAVADGPAAFVNKWLWQDPIDALIGFASTRCKGFPNWQHASIPTLDDALQDWLRATSWDALQDAASRAQRVAAEELPYVPLVTPDDVWVHTSRLRGLRPYPADIYPRYQEAWLDGDG